MEHLRHLALVALTCLGTATLGACPKERENGAPATAPKASMGKAAAKAPRSRGTAAAKAPGGEPTPATAPAKPRKLGKVVGKRGLDRRGLDRRGLDLIADAKLLFEVVACPGSGMPEAPGFDKRVLRTHCKRLRRQIARYRKNYVVKARPWLATLQPKNLPTTVVYPFGGGDLLSALTTYARAREITTMSLEHAGDVRGVRRLRGRKLAQNLKLLRQTIAGLLALDDSTSKNMMKMQKTPIPGQLAFFLVALSVYDYEPVSLRYFRVEQDGTLHYYDAAEIAALRKKRAHGLSGAWPAAASSKAFSNSELVFRKRGDKDGQRIVHRHIAANLANVRLPEKGALLTHLRAKGKVATMTKAAAYLLWRRGFSRIREYLLEKMVYMVSDSTGIPPRYALHRGFSITTYGRYRLCFFETRFDARVDAQLIELWRRQRYRRLPFRYGYPDRKGSWHLMITQR